MYQNQSSGSGTSEIVIARKEWLSRCLIHHTWESAGMWAVGQCECSDYLLDPQSLWPTLIPHVSRLIHTGIRSLWGMNSQRHRRLKEKRTVVKGTKRVSNTPWKATWGALSPETQDPYTLRNWEEFWGMERVILELPQTPLFLTLVNPALSDHLSESPVWDWPASIRGVKMVCPALPFLHHR